MLRLSRSLLVRLAQVALVTWAAGCVITPRLPIDVSAAVARDDMRVARSETVDLYYPAHQKREAHALLARAEGCVARLRAAAVGKGGLYRDRVELIFADLPFNNAFVKPPSGGDFFSVIPTHFTLDLTSELGVPLGPDYVACHEITHYIHVQQTLRSLGGLNKAFGYLVTPQLGLDAWFAEGLATYYEQVLSPGTGRPAWPVWEGMFHAAVAEQRVTGGHFNALRRQIHWGNHYLYGSHFVAYLVATYGEEKLWRLIERQGKSFFFPFTVNQRFKRVYGKSLSRLLDDFAAFAAHRYGPKARPAEQHTVREVGMDGRYARAKDGSEAVVSEAMDQPPTLTVYDAHGRERYRRLLTDVLPRRHLVAPSVVGLTGLRFSRDARKLYFVMVDPGPVYQRARLFELDLGSAQLRQVVRDLSGLGGDVSPDGRSYLYVHVDGGGHALSVLDLATGQTRELFRAPSGVYLASPSYSPDGSTILASAFDRTFAFYLFDARSGAHTDTLSAAGRAVHDPSWVDDQRILFLGEHERRFQVFSYDRSTQETRRITSAPYVALSPRAAGNTVRFLNREGNAYSLDEVQLEGGAQALRATARFLADVHEAHPSTPPLMLQATPQEPAAAPLPVPSAEPAPDAQLAPDATPPEEALDLTDRVMAPEPSAPATTTDAPTAEAPAAPSGAAPEGQLSPSPAPGRLVLPTPELSLRTGPPAQVAPLATRPLTRVEDDSYSSFPRIFVPSIRAPIVAFGTSETGLPIAQIGFYLGGTDALGFHRWGISAALQPKPLLWSGSVGYLNAQLAPFLWMVGASQLDIDHQRLRMRDKDGDGEKDDPHYTHRRQRQRDLFWLGYLALRTTGVGLSVHATQDYQPDDAALTLLSMRKRSLGGGTLLFDHAAIESTPMSGPRRGYVVNLASSYYPDWVGSLDFALTDLRGALTLYSPLPFSRRHTLSLGLRARALLHPGPLQLLEVGGNPAGKLFDQPDERDSVYYPGLPPTRRFAEPLRGFETYPFAADRIGIAELRYRYPWVLDVGTATSLSILPAFFLRQVDFELFGVGAAESRHVKNEGHTAAGAALGLQMVWLVPLTLRYQVSRRFSDDEAFQHLLMLTPTLEP